MGIDQGQKSDGEIKKSMCWAPPALWCLSLFLLAISCLLVVVITFPGSVDIQRYSSGIFDADVPRIVSNITTFATTEWHSGKHPLFLILLTPISLITGYLQVTEITNARLVCTLGIGLQTLCIMGIVRAACPAATWLAPLAAAIFLSSFSALLFVTIPESCAWSGLSGLLPILFFVARRDKRFVFWEALGWALLLPLSVGYTITQGVFWLLAISFRVGTLWADSGSRAALRGVLMGFLAVSLGCVAVLGLARWQHEFNPLPPLYEYHPMTGQAAYMRPLAISSVTWELFLSVINQMLAYPFVPPILGYSQVVKYLGYWCLSFEQLNTNPSDQLWYVDLLRGCVVFLLFGILPFAYRAGTTAAILILGICSQVVLHLFYGREFVLYSLNWLGLVIVLSVITASRLNSRVFKLWLVGFSVVIPLTIIWNICVLDRVMKEVSYGLDEAKRTTEGAPKGPLSSLPSRG